MQQRRPGRPATPLNPDSSSAARLGAEIRVRRQEQGLTLQELADRIAFSPQHLSEVELAKAPASRPFIAACDRALEAGGALVALLPAAVYERATQRHDRDSARRVSTRSASRGRRADAADKPEPAINRLGLSDAMVEGSGESRDDRLRHAVRHPTRVDFATAAGLRDRIAELDARYIREPSMSLLVEVGRCLGDVGFLRVHATSDRVRQHLYAAEAEAAILMGQLVWDASQRREYAVARSYLRHAVRAARHDHNTAAEGLALLRLSMVALYSERNPNAGLALAAHAAGVTATASGVIAGLATLHTAEALAMLGRRTDCERALVRADTRLERVERSDPAAHLFSPTQRGRMAGSCYLSLGDHGRACATLQETADALRDGSKAQAIVLGNLALAHVRLGALDAAIPAVHEAIDLLESTRGGGGLNVVSGVAREMRPWRQSQAVEDVHDRLLGLIATT